MNRQEKVYIPLGLYVHVPFCAAKCDYCAFYKEPPSRQNLECYLHALLLEIQFIHDERAFDTIYFGGGTPGILSPKVIDQIATTLHSKIHKMPLEWTLEIAPSTVNMEKLQHWKAAGVNRISMGIQSFNGVMLRTLGRKQTLQQIFHAYELVRSTGFTNVGIDLIFSAPGQTNNQLLDDLSTAIALSPEHISTYCLSYEDGTVLKNRLGDGAEENRDHDFYEIVCEFLETHGYQQYEISNFCKNGYASVHNRNTWLMHEWIGIGPSASSQYGELRYTNVASLDRWATGIENGIPERTDVVKLNKQMLAIDEIIFGLRMNDGVDLEKNPHHERLAEFFHDLYNEALLIREDSRVRLTQRGRLLCDAIAKEIFNALE
ncbi:MAG: radical SAM family heme chaperone HemW [Puniceicoccales bacterium]|jgi:oxygen-independent coproporphyrinogen-3 oxidase|nr:radical SAM family heme chaperone HemW [Puniceicoccales bacterium]